MRAPVPLRSLPARGGAARHPSPLALQPFALSPLSRRRSDVCPDLGCGCPERLALLFLVANDRFEHRPGGCGLPLDGIHHAGPVQVESLHPVAERADDRPPSANGHQHAQRESRQQADSTCNSTASSSTWQRNQLGKALTGNVGNSPTTVSGTGSSQPFSWRQSDRGQDLLVGAAVRAAERERSAVGARADVEAGVVIFVSRAEESGVLPVCAGLACRSPSRPHERAPGSSRARDRPPIVLVQLPSHSSSRIQALGEQTVFVGDLPGRLLDNGEARLSTLLLLSAKLVTERDPRISTE
jgi:hypothetical protein